MPATRLTILARAALLSVAASDLTAAELLTDPFLQAPAEDGVHVVWFTEFEGTDHRVRVENSRDVTASTTKMSRLAEDRASHVGTQAGDGSIFGQYTPRDIWRHEAYVDGLAPGARQTYSVRSTTAGGETVESRTFSLAPLPTTGQPLRILLTSDHQLKPMTAASLQKVAETVGTVDAVFFPGDLQSIPDRASEWFDDRRGSAFFPALQGKAAQTLEGTGVTYRGGELIQHAPLFPAIGNHEVMGRFNPSNGLDGMYGDPRPRAVAEVAYDAHEEIYNPSRDPDVRERWIRDNSFNTITYEELFTLPDAGPGGERYYAQRFGDIFLISLHGTRIWRSPSMAPDVRGKYREAAGHVDRPDEWGWGSFIFEDMAEGSAQHGWLREVLDSEAFRSAPVKVVLMHHPAHGLGDNSVPPFAHPQQIRDYDDTGRLAGIRYEYPIDDDIFVRHVEPMLAAAGVDLLLTGHSHVWYRFVSPDGINILETSNVGNSYGCFLDGHAERGNAPTDPRFEMANYPTTGDPHGYVAVAPTGFAPQRTGSGEPLPCVASNTLTVFSILETNPEEATVSSYVFDTSNPTGAVRLFDRFTLN